MASKRISVMVSGSGTNLQAILDAAVRGDLQAQVVLVVSNHKHAYGLARAELAGVPTLYFPLKPYRDGGKSRAQYDADLAAEIGAYRPDLVVLAGWMHVLSPAFLDRFPHQVINLHPALPGMYAGTHAIERAFRDYQEGSIKHSGCMVHYAIPEVDAGEVLVQRVVPILPEDTLDSFEARMHANEHEIIVEATRLALAGGQRRVASVGT